MLHVKERPDAAELHQLSPATARHCDRDVENCAAVSGANPWLSILVPVYNVAGFLEDCLQSILQQLESGIEVVVVDDASTDSSLAIVERFRLQFGKQIRVVRHTRNRGIASARNSLMENAGGDYFWFVDADDLLSDGAIASLRKVLDSASPDFLTCDFRVLRERFQLKHRLRGEAHRSTFGGTPRLLNKSPSALVSGILIKGQFHVWSKIGRRDVWQRVRFPDGRNFEDIAALPMLLDGVDSHYHVPEPWVAYRQRQGSILSTMNAEKARDQLRALRDLGAAMGPSRRLLDDEEAFALQHYMLTRLSSVARHTMKWQSDEREELICLLCEILFAHFPGGPRGVLLAYCRRGWFLRAWRAHGFFQWIGKPAADAP